MSDLVNIENSEGSVMTDDEYLVYTQGKRKALVEDIVGKGIPADNDDRRVLLTALADMDRSALSNKKIGSKEKTGQADRQAALLIARMANTLGGNSPFERHDLVDGTIPEFNDQALPPLRLVVGEMVTGISTQGFDEFMESVENRQPESNEPSE